MSDQLRTEIQAFERMRPSLEEHHGGKHALIKGDTLVSTFDTFERAAEEGLRLYPADDFLIRQIGPTGHVTMAPPTLCGFVNNADTQKNLRIEASSQP